MLQIWDIDWQLDEAQCPCDVHFQQWLEAEGIKGRSIYHFGTGGHHYLGLANMAKGGPNTIFGITASPKEYDCYVKLAIEHAELTRHYQVVFGDIYLLNTKLLPPLDMATMFHLCEFRNEQQDKYGGLTDRQVMETMLKVLPIGGLLILYTGSFAYPSADPIAKAMQAEGLIDRVSTFKTLEFYRKR